MHVSRHPFRYNVQFRNRDIRFALAGEDVFDGNLQPYPVNRVFQWYPLWASAIGDVQDGCITGRREKSDAPNSVILTENDLVFLIAVSNADRSHQPFVEEINEDPAIPGLPPGLGPSCRQVVVE